MQGNDSIVSSRPDDEVVGRKRLVKSKDFGVWLTGFRFNLNINNEN